VAFPFPFSLLSLCSPEVSDVWLAPGGLGSVILSLTGARYYDKITYCQPAFYGEVARYILCWSSGVFLSGGVEFSTQSLLQRGAPCVA
jgi:hypothetical protein